MFDPRVEKLADVLVNDHWNSSPVGNSYPETGRKNESGVYWDLLCGMQDGELFCRSGKPLMCA